MQSSSFACWRYCALTLGVVVIWGWASATTGAPPVVRTVPWVANKPLIPHDTYAGRQVTLKGTSDQEGPDIRWIWDFGDGSPTASGTVVDRNAIEATHSFPGAVGTLYTAR